MLGVELDLEKGQGKRGLFLLSTYRMRRLVKSLPDQLRVKSSWVAVLMPTSY